MQLKFGTNDYVTMISSNGIRSEIFSIRTSIQNAVNLPITLNCIHLLVDDFLKQPNAMCITMFALLFI